MKIDIDIDKNNGELVGYGVERFLLEKVNSWIIIKLSNVVLDMNRLCTPAMLDEIEMRYFHED